MLKPPHPLSRARLEKLSTQRLLQVLRLARANHNSLYCSCCSLPTYQTGLYTEEEWTKEATKTQEYIKSLKEVLSAREHIQKDV